MLTDMRDCESAVDVPWRRPGQKKAPSSRVTSAGGLFHGTVELQDEGEALTETPRK